MTFLSLNQPIEGPKPKTKSIQPFFAIPPSHLRRPCSIKKNKKNPGQRFFFLSPPLSFFSSQDFLLPLAAAAAKGEGRRKEAIKRKRFPPPSSLPLVVPSRCCRLLSGREGGKGARNKLANLGGEERLREEKIVAPQYRVRYLVIILLPRVTCVLKRRKSRLLNF